MPVDRHRYHYVWVRVRVRQHMDGLRAVLHGLSKRVGYAAQERSKQFKKGKAPQVRHASPSQKSCFSLRLPQPF